MQSHSIQLVIAALVFVAVTFVGSALLVAAGARRRALRPRLYDGGAPLSGDYVGNAGQGTVGLLNRMGSKAALGRPSDQLQASLSRAGFHAKSAPDVYLGAKIVLLVIGVLGASALLVPVSLPVPLKVMAAVMGGAACSFIPNLVLNSRLRARTLDVRRALPHATDLLEICVSAGMGLDMAWNAVSDEIRHVSDVLADEMALTNLEMQLGATRPVAMRHMAERTGAEELSSLVALLLQSERFGTSIADALRTFASGMREERSQKAEETAEKMSVKLLFPMVLFIFPAILIVMGGPAGIRLYEHMAGQ
jgi:tight adherence protein C